MKQRLALAWERFLIGVSGETRLAERAPIPPHAMSAWHGGPAGMAELVHAGLQEQKRSKAWKAGRFLLRVFDATPPGWT